MMEVSALASSAPAAPDNGLLRPSLSPPPTPPSSSVSSSSSSSSSDRVEVGVDDRRFLIFFCPAHLRRRAPLPLDV
jgi:hypothetical protein